MKNPFLNADQYSFVRQFKKLELRTSSASNSSKNNRISSTGSLSNSHHNHKFQNHYSSPRKEFFPEKYVHNFKRIQNQGVKLYGLQSLRYKPENISTKTIFKKQEEEEEQVFKQTYETDISTFKSPQINKSLKSNMKPSLKMSKNFEKSSKAIKKQVSNILIKKRNQSGNTQLQKRGSMLTSMLNFNFKFDPNNIYEYDSSEQESEADLSNRKISRVNILKSYGNSKKKVTGYNEKSYDDDQYQMQFFLQNEKDYIISESIIDKSQKSLKSTGKALKSSKGSSLSIKSKKNLFKFNPPGQIKFRGKKFKLERKHCRA